MLVPSEYKTILQPIGIDIPVPETVLTVNV